MVCVVVSLVLPVALANHTCTTSPTTTTAFTGWCVVVWVVGVGVVVIRSLSVGVGHTLSHGHTLSNCGVWWCVVVWWCVFAFATRGTAQASRYAHVRRGVGAQLLTTVGFGDAHSPLEFARRCVVRVSQCDLTSLRSVSPLRVAS